MEDSALHSLRIGGATDLSAGGATPVLQHEGRRASDAYNAYVRSHGEDTGRVASVITRESARVTGSSRGRVRSGDQWVDSPSRVGSGNTLTVCSCSYACQVEERRSYKVPQKVQGGG